MTGSRYTIPQLAERTGVPATTVYHYRSLGLLPTPQRDDRDRSLYDERAVEAIALIRLLRDRRRLPLREIAEVLPELLGDAEQSAFRPEIWDEALEHRLVAERGPRARIVAASVRLFAARGYGEVAVADIAEAAELAKGSVYRHFSSKEDLFVAAVDAVVDQLLTAYEGAAADRDDPLDVDAAASLLVAVAPPEALPLLLELGARATRGHAHTARLALDRLACGVVAPLGGGPDEAGAPTGSAVLERALATALRATLTDRRP